MTEEKDPDELVEELSEEAAALAYSLHTAVEQLRRPRPAHHVSAPVAAIFDQPPGAKPRHRAGRPSAELIELAVDAAVEVRERLGYAPLEDNPALVPLALACFYVADARRTNAFGLGVLAAAQPLARVVPADEAHRDPVLPEGTALIRIWSELRDEAPVCVELRLSA